jgi:hypothetical protein
MSALNTFESRLQDAWTDLTTDVRDELEQGYAEVKAEVAQFAPLLTKFKADAEAALEAAEPGIKTSVTGLVESLLADAAKIGVTLGV